MFISHMWKNAFSDSPNKAAHTAITNPRTPKKIWAGMICSLMWFFKVGNKNATKPIVYCIENKTTADKPIQEWREYIFGIGFGAKLWESKTAIKATIVKINANPWVNACEIFNVRFGWRRNFLYRRIAEKSRLLIFEKIWKLVE